MTSRALERALRRQLAAWREPHTLAHIAYGPTAEVEGRLGRSYHVGSVEGETCAICLTCGRCIDCSRYLPDQVWDAARAHPDDIALLELRKLGVRLLDELGA